MLWPTIPIDDYISTIRFLLPKWNSVRQIVTCKLELIINVIYIKHTHINKSTWVCTLSLSNLTFGYF